MTTFISLNESDFLCIAPEFILVRGKIRKMSFGLRDKERERELKMRTLRKKVVDSSYLIFFSLDYILPLNYILYLPDLILSPLAREDFSNTDIF